MQAVRLLRRASLAAFIGALAATSAFTQSGNDDQQRTARYEGGELSGPLAAYVAAVGKRVAQQAGRPDIRFTVVRTYLQRESQAVQAFATTSGVYVPAPRLYEFNDEAQLACLLGHEVAHIVAGHTEIDGQSAEQEIEADRLGLKYMASAGYDPAACLEVNPTFGEVGVTWATFPGNDTVVANPGAAEAALARARAMPQYSHGERNRDRFLVAIDGLVVWSRDDGGLRDGKFVHPVLGFEFDVPAGYEVRNGADAVRIVGRKGALQLREMRYRGDRKWFLTNVIKNLVAPRELPPLNFLEISNNGLQATATGFTADTDERSKVYIGPYTFLPNANGRDYWALIAYQWSPDTVYYFVSFSGFEGWGPFRDTVRSFRRLSPQEAASYHNQVVRVLTVGPNDTLQSMQSRGFQDMKRFLQFNNLENGARLTPGQKLKVLVESNR